jgi:hypothetical protein
MPCSLYPLGGQALEVFCWEGVNGASLGCRAVGYGHA